MTEMETVAFDIETTGFGPDETLTVAGFDLSLGSRVFLTTGDRPGPDDLDTRLSAELARPVTLSTHETERGLLAALASFVETKVGHREAKLVAYNGETWNGGFDLPFLRTRLTRHDIDWPFGGLPYVDAMAVFETRFNTTADTLPAVYDELVDGDLGGLDPFDDSGAAVDAWQAGAFEPLVRHNVADIRRTRALMGLAERYCSKSDFSMKSLDPVA